MMSVFVCDIVHEWVIWGVVLSWLSIRIMWNSCLDDILRSMWLYRTVFFFVECVFVMYVCIQ